MEVCHQHFGMKVIPVKWSLKSRQFKLLRLVYYLFFFILFLFFTFHLIPQTPEEQGERTPLSSSQGSSKGEKYLSWFPHSDFPEQQESFRNAIRLAIDTGRTIIAPMLRIHRSYPWMPFEALAKRYEAQEKTILKDLCDNHEDDWRVQLEPCETLNDWFEVPWSSIMNLEAVKRDFGVKIIERTHGHGWGIHESALSEPIAPDDVAVIDVMSFPENGTDWEHADIEKDLMNKPSMYQWIQTHFLPQNQDPLTQPLKNVFAEDRLKNITQKIIQFGGLNSAARYPTTVTDKQQELRKALMKTHFVVPDRMKALKQQSTEIVNVLGGRFQYSTLIFNLSSLVTLDARAKAMEITSMDDLEEKARTELMEALVLEIFGDIPINQAVSAAMPIQPSKLATLLKTNATEDRRTLLDACVDYHKNVESRYPVYYLINEMNLAPETRLDIFGPLLDMFPCMFSRSDMVRWGIQSDHWAKGQPELYDKQINYERLLQPLLDILIAGKGYSFFEIPTTPLTRFLNWSPKPNK
ncbi:hypothetical protein BDB01DRAFT_354256 [Pilobolus umbonatus]|nr:hypothetical protein BDB01DRAFT_354256 [Pilobolus umbonatus]